MEIYYHQGWTPKRIYIYYLFIDTNCVIYFCRQRLLSVCNICRYAVVAGIMIKILFYGHVGHRKYAYLISFIAIKFKKTYLKGKDIINHCVCNWFHMTLKLMRWFSYFADTSHSPLSSHENPPHDQLLTSLEKQLSIEMKVKNGAENMIQSITGDRHGRDKKQLLAEAQQMLADAKAKIEFLKLRILKVRQNRQLNKVNCTLACSHNKIIHIFFFRFRTRMATVNVVRWSHRWRSESKSCCTVYESKRP